MGFSVSKLEMIKIFKCLFVVCIAGLVHPVRRLLALTYLNPTQA